MSDFQGERLLALMSEPRGHDVHRARLRRRQHLDGGELLLNAVVAQLTDASSGGAASRCFTPMLGYLTRRQVTGAARRLWRTGGAEGDAPTQSSLQWQWPEHEDFLRDVVIWTLRARLPRLGDLPLAEGVIRQVPAGLSPLEALTDLAWEHVIRLLRQPAFRLQVVVGATPLAFDSRVAEALQYIASDNADAWSPFWREIVQALGSQLCTDSVPQRLALGWHIGIESVARVALPSAGFDPNALTVGEQARSLLKIILDGLFPVAGAAAASETGHSS